MNTVLVRILTALRTRAANIAADVASGVRALHDLNEIRTGFEMLWHMMVRGGVRVETPAGPNPMIATTVQLDGDLFTVLHRDAESCVALQRDHFEALEQTLRPLHALANFAALGRMVIALLNLFAITAAGTVAAGAIAEAERALWYGMAGTVIPLVLRATAPLVIRMSVSRLFRSLQQQWQRDSDPVLLRLRAEIHA